MAAWVGLDCGKLTTNVCILGSQGEVLAETAVESEPDVIAGYLRGQGFDYDLVGLEASSAAWLRTGLAAANLPVVAIEAFHAHGVLRARTNKTDRNDARGIAEMMRLGVYRSVHTKGVECRRLRLLLNMRDLLLRKQLDLEKAVRAALLEYGLKLPTGRRKTLASRVRILLVAQRNSFLEDIAREVFDLCEAIGQQVRKYEDQIVAAADDDPICRRLMTAPGIGPLTAVAYRCAIDDPRRFARSRDVAAYLGLTPRASRSGRTGRTGRLSKRGDADVRKLLFLASRSVLRPGARASWLQSWGRGVAISRGSKKAHIAVARRLAVILHRMWIDGTEFRWTLGDSVGT